jgi:Carbohydrate binding domain (family 11)
VAATGAALYVQYQEPTQKTVDNFEGVVPDWQVSTIGGDVTHNATLPADPLEGKMHDHVDAPGLDPKSPHDTKGLRLRWDNSSDRLLYEIPPSEKNVSGFATLSFRITQVVGSPHNAANQGQNLRVALKDSAGNERAVRVSAFAEIPYPDPHPWGFTKSAMTTIRIPLKSYTIVCAGQPQVDLKKVASLSFAFSEKVTGEVEIDEVAFSN